MGIDDIPALKARLLDAQDETDRMVGERDDRDRVLEEIAHAIDVDPCAPFEELVPAIYAALKERGINIQTEEANDAE